MTRPIRHILVAVGAERRPPKKELRKAGILARAARRARVELFHTIEESDPGAGFPETATAAAVANLRAASVLKHRRRLERCARDAALRGLKVSCSATWDRPPHEAIIRRALAVGADLVVAATRSHRGVARLVLRNTDWELIRHCPLPLLLAKGRRPYRRPVILVAVDPFHAHAKPANLDARLLEAAGLIARRLRGTVHIFHAYMPLIAVSQVPVTAAPLLLPPPQVEQAHREQVEREVGRLAASAGIPPNRCHVVVGDVTAELGALARRLGAALVVMGAVSRSALARLVIGNTAERVLDKLPCDALIVKPRGFRPSVHARRR